MGNKKLSEVISMFEQLKQEYGDIEFIVNMPHIGGVDYDIGLKEDKRDNSKQIFLSPSPKMEQMLGATLDGENPFDGETHVPPCETCDKSDCPSHPSKKH